MKARFLGVQEFTSADGELYYKVFFAVEPEKKVNRFENDKGQEMIVRYHGEKVQEIKTDRSGFAALSQIEGGQLVQFDLTPNPSKPSQNIITGATVL